MVWLNNSHIAGGKKKNQVCWKNMTETEAEPG